jgi:predicted MFS family arabinose efflux permease
VSRSLLRNRDFMLLWTAQSVSDLGSAVMVFALPLAAVTMINASVFEIGVLSAAGTAAWLLLTLPAGALVDRVAKRPLIIWCGLSRAAIVATVPAAAAFDRVTFPHLCAVAFLTGAITVVFEVACQSYAPAIVSPGHLAEGNGKIATSNAVAGVAGPSAAGGLMAVLNTPAVFLADSLSYLAAAVSMWFVRTVEPHRRRAAGGAREGVVFVLRHPVLRRIVACSAVGNAGDTMVVTLIVIHLLDDLRTSPATAGLVVGLGSAGGVIGGLVATSLARRWGVNRALWGSKLILGAFALLIPLGQPGWGIMAVAAGLFAARLSTVAYNVLQITYRQSVCPPELLGRMNASVRWMIRGAIPISALLAGSLGSWLGVRTTLAIAVTASWLSVLWIVLSPIRHADGPASLADPRAGTESR